MERRLTAVLCADVVGYSRLMEADEVGALAELKAHRAEFIDLTIAAHHGRIVKVMGDGLLAEFASVVDAVACALDIQKGMAARNTTVSEDRRHVLRIGVNLGDVIVEGDDLYGGGVNVAARLQAMADPAGICISGTVFDHVERKLDCGYEFLGARRVKNIEKPVPVYRVLAAPDAVGKVIAARPRPGLVWRWSAAGALALLVAIGGLAAWLNAREPPIESASIETMALPMRDKPSIAVLPFDNLSRDPANDYVSDGLTEDIIDALGRHKALAVIALNAVADLEDGARGPSEIARDLSVQYFLKGSVRRARDRMRVSVRLNDAGSGVLIWSEQFDDQEGDIFAFQDSIARRVAGSLNANITQEELRRSATKPTSHLDAYDLVLQGRAQLRHGSRRGNREARELFRRALEIDPEYAAALAWMARAHYLMATDGWTEFPAEALKQADGFATRALEIDPELVESHRTLARVHAIQFQLERAIAGIDQALMLNPSDAEAHGDRGLILLWAGQPEEAARALETAFTYDPNLRADYFFAHGLALYSLRRHDEAIRVLEQGAARYPTYVFIPAVLVAAYGQEGRIDEAQRNAEKLRRLSPFFDFQVFGARFQDKALHDYLAEGLKKGGLL